MQFTCGLEECAFDDSPHGGMLFHCWPDCEGCRFAVPLVDHDLISARSYFSPCDSVDIFDFLSEKEVAEWNHLATSI